MQQTDKKSIPENTLLLLIGSFIRFYPNYGNTQGMLNQIEQKGYDTGLLYWMNEELDPSSSDLEGILKDPMLKLTEEQQREYLTIYRQRRVESGKED